MKLGIKRLLDTKYIGHAAAVFESSFHLKPIIESLQLDGLSADDLYVTKHCIREQLLASQKTIEPRYAWVAHIKTLYEMLGELDTSYTVVFLDEIHEQDYKTSFPLQCLVEQIVADGYNDNH